ncbi:MAG: xanthine dehydrogenase family protein subunit M [Woeseiaceae bacterium]|nr:xanthine dehydrogenase family protein subunit M [Woeseiaceae bacterium]
MHAFEYHRPASLAAAERLLEDDGCHLLAGGMTLLPTMKMRLAQPAGLVDLGRVDALRGIREDGDGIEIGAMATHAEVAESALVRERLPALASLAARIGDPQVRNRGTLGGSLANSDPAADYPAAVLASAAIIVTNRRTIAADEFFVDMFETALAPPEIVVAVRFPAIRQAAYEKFRNPASRYAIAGVMVAVVGGEVRVAVTGAGPCAFRATAFEAALARRFDATALDGIDIDGSGFNDDVHASQAYRAHLVGVLAKRAVRAA